MKKNILFLIIFLSSCASSPTQETIYPAPHNDYQGVIVKEHFGKEDPYDFERRMNVKVIPLLLEYFMNDAKAVTQIVSRALSNTKYSINEKSWPLRITEKND